MRNLTLENITRACQGTYHGDADLLSREVAGVTIDSRKVEKDYLFVAINGERFNAHQFLSLIHIYCLYLHLAASQEADADLF